MKSVCLQPAYLLHRRPYRETSFLLELFTKEYGRITLIAKGVSRARSATQGLLQPFHPLLISFAGRGELAILTQVESQGQVQLLQGKCLFAGFYLNELLMRLLQKWDPHHLLYLHYEKALFALGSGTLEQKILRIFEKRLLEELGYGLLPKSQSSLEQTFLPQHYYQFIPDQGFIEVQPSGLSERSVFSGKSLLALANEDWPDEESLQDAKRLIRLVLEGLLGSKPVYSRKLFLYEE